MKTLKKIIKSRFAAIRDRLAAIPAAREKVCRGYALGVFLAATPFIGVKVPIALLLATLLKWNKAASVIGVFHVNFLTAPFFYGVSYLVGRVLLRRGTIYVIPDDFTLKTSLAMLSSHSGILLDFLIGGLALGIPLAIGAYWLAKKVLKW